MIKINDYIREFSLKFPGSAEMLPWDVVQEIQSILEQSIRSLPAGYRIRENIAIHETSVIENNAVLKGPLIIGPNCFVAANCYLRKGVFLDEGVTLGPGCEVKSSFIFSGSSLAHFNFVGDSIIGSGVNLEAGAVIANHWNERTIRDISVLVGGTIMNTGLQKFGAIVGDGTKIGANAVLSPGTILPPGSIVDRLQLVRQLDE